MTIGRSVGEASGLAVRSLVANPARSALAITGIVIGIVTVVLVASVLANVRNQIALLFRELGTDNVFAFHLSGDPYQPPSADEAGRRPLEADFARTLAGQGEAIEQVASQLLVPSVIGGRALTARAVGDRTGGAVSDSVLVEGASANYFDVTGSELAAGRPFTDLEDRAGAAVTVIGASLARALYGERPAERVIGERVLLAGDRYTVVGVLAPRKGGFFGENRQDSVMAIPAGTVGRRFPSAENVVLYVRGEPGRLEAAQRQTETILRRLRRLPAEEDNDFNLSTSEQIIRTFDRVSAAIGAVTIALAAVSLLIGGIGIANVMVIAVFERTREIGVRRAVGARRRDVLRQFLIEAALLSTAGGVAGVVLAGLLGGLLALALPGYSATPPGWAVAAGLLVSGATGIVAGYLPARRAAGLDPVEALRTE